MLPGRAKTLLLVGLVLLARAYAARIPPEDFWQIEQYSASAQQKGQLDSSSPEHSTEQGGPGDNFGDYYFYRDELSATDSTSSQPSGVHHAAEQRNAYVLEDASGRMSVVEHESRPLPGGGMMSWVRQTAPGSESYTMVSTSSTDSISQDSLVNTASPSFRLAHAANSMFSGSLGNIFAPINDLLDAMDAQQQRIMGQLAAAQFHRPMLAHHSQHMHGVMPHRMDQLHQHHSGKPCPKHQNLMSAAASEARAAATAAHEALHQQHEQELDIFEQFAAQQQEEMERQMHQVRLQELLARNGLAVAANGELVHMEDEQQQVPVPASSEQHHSDLEDVYADFAESPVRSFNPEHLYDTEDEDYYVLDGPVHPQLNASEDSSVWWGIDADIDLDMVLLVLLVACTTGMCLAFFRSLLQLRAVLHGQQYSGCNVKTADAKPIVLAAALAGAAAAKCCADRQGSGCSDDDDLTKPLLISAGEGNFAHEHQEGASATAPSVQSFYNPLCYQQLPGKM